MALVSCKCTNCGATMLVDNTKDAAVCEYCGSAFVVEKAINNYNVTNNIEAGVVNVYGGNSPDFVIRGGKLEQYNGASTDVIIPNSVKVIGNKAFLNCSALSSVIIPESVTDIEDGEYDTGAFYGCNGLKSITIPDNVVKIGDQAFYCCNGLSNVIIGNGVLSIGKAAFARCKNLSSVHFGNSITTIRDSAFFECNSLKKVKLPNSIINIGYNAFSSCSNLLSINIPYGVTSIANFLFYNCIRLVDVSISESVTSIGDNAFSGCENLESVVIPESVTNIGLYSFLNCTSLSSINIPNSVNCIGTGAFDNCNSLPKTVRNEIQKRSKGCYIATAVYGSYDCPEVWVLRRFRDNILYKTWYGRVFIRIYYNLSPYVVKVFGSNSFFKRLCRIPLDKLVAKLRSKGVKNTPYKDK